MRYVLAAGLLMLALSVPGINFYHHLTLPEFKPADRITSYWTGRCYFPWITKHYDVRLENEVKGPEKYYDITKILQDASYGDTVTFHLVGNGGQADTLFLLINNIHQSKADITMQVEGPVYSAHAYLAINGDHLILDKYAFMMFHTSSIVNVDCSKQVGSDRGVSNAEHCQALKNSNMYLTNVLIDSAKYLTPNQKQQIKTGHDVYLYSKEVK